MTGKIHSDFRLNGLVCDRDALLEVGYSFIKEGEEYERPIGDFLLDWLSDSPAVIVKTSGSTGPPKNIALTKQSMMASAMATAEFLGLQSGTKALLCLSAGHIAGKMMLVRAMVLGWSLELVSPSSSPLLETLNRFDFCAMVPLQLRSSFRHLDRVKTIIVGGAPLSGKDADMLSDIETKVYETYGMTETASHIALKPIIEPVIGEDTAIPFTVLPGIKLSQDDKGCLVIELPWDPVQTIRTNDIVELIGPDRFNWLGRVDNVINSGGVKLYPELIEKKLSGLIDNRFILLGLPDDDLGQRLVLVIEGQVNKEEVINAIREQHGKIPYEIPKEILSMEKFPETENGKINRPDIYNWAVIR
ncbi:MAG: AMP-binding protein [Flavobacteriaceae bacterium]